MWYAKKTIAANHRLQVATKKNCKTANPVNLEQLVIIHSFRKPAYKTTILKLLNAIKDVI